MSTSQQPLVSVLTPVHNGEKHLAECIESVLDQTYKNWEYVIVNNCSTDRTLEVANTYAEKDTRVRVHNNKEFFKIIQNWNYALRQISLESKYCKIIHADDLLFPECIERMIEVAEKNPRVGIVGSYVLRGTRVAGDGFPYPGTVVSGRDVCRATFRKDYYVFGSPSAILTRSDLIRRRNTFYNERNFHADVEACFDVLQDTDFGFVHQILSHKRLHDETQTATVAEIYNTGDLENLLGVLKKYGPIYCNNEEFQQYWNAALDRYYKMLAKSVLQWKAKEFWTYHKRGLEKIGLRLSIWRLVAATLLKVADLLLNPKLTAEKIRKRF